MIIIGCDFHTRFQQIAMLDPTTGETVERRLEHETGEAEKFYASLPGPARVGVEATIPRSGSREHWLATATNSGWEMRPRSERRGCGSRKPTRAMLSTSSIYSSRIGFRESGRPHPPSETFVSSCGTGTSWLATAPR